MSLIFSSFRVYDSRRGKAGAAPIEGKDALWSEIAGAFEAMAKAETRYRAKVRLDIRWGDATYQKATFRFDAPKWLLTRKTLAPIGKMLEERG